MEWKQLLSLKRHGDIAPRPRDQQDEMRLGFEVDYDRVIFSQHFRSLQDKTQVIPLSQTGFVHTRLTHSLEVSVVGRSLGRMAGQRILSRHTDLIDAGYKFQDFGAIIAAASLAHDIGNPPFGHSGEKAIGSYFSRGKGQMFLDTLSRKQQQDLIDYEGNANGYKLLNTDTPGTPGGLRLSYATLGAFIKYPKESLPIKPTDHVAHKKFGVFQSEMSHFTQVAHELGMVNNHNQPTSYYRHPLAYLVEAADDICYTIIDFEDGINLGWIPEDYALEYLINLVRSTIKTSTYAQLQTTQQRLTYLRALTINSLISDCVAIFMDHEDQILRGDFKHALMDKSQFKPQINDILSITVDRVYRHQEVVHKEIAGYKILTDILDAVATASVNDLNNNITAYDRLILNSCHGLLLDSDSVYDRLINACGYVASLTDSKSLQLFKVINGSINN